MVKFRVAAQASACAMAFVLAACGGGGGSGGGGGVISTPAPSPSPSPSPSPTPTPTNTDLLEPLVSQTFTNEATRGTLNVTATGRTTTQGEVTATISYDASNQTYSLTTPTGSISFGPGDIDNAQSSEGAVVYVRTNGNQTDSLTLTRPGTSGPITYQYVGSAFWQRTVTGTTTGSGSLDAIVYGVPTPNADVPRTGTADYAIDLLGATTVGDNLAPLAGSGSVSIDFQSGDIIILGTLTVAPFLAPDSSFNGSATLSSTSNTFSGTFTLFDFGRYDGTISGMLFGPNTEEIGGSWAVADTTDRVAVGTIMGREGSASTNTQFNESGNLLDDSQTFRNLEQSLTFQFNQTSTNAGTFSNIATGQGEAVWRYDEGTNSLFLSSGGRSNIYDLVNSRFSDLGPQDTADYALEGYTYVKAGAWRLRSPNLDPDFRYSFHLFGFETEAGNVPRTGSGGYRLLFEGSAADPDYNNPIFIDGTGVLRTDFEAGTLTLDGGLTFGERLALSGVDEFSGTGTVTGSGTISSSANSFSGNLSFDGLGAYAGTFNGAFFGPEGQELGAVFTASDDNGTAAGTFVGQRDAALESPDNLVNPPGPLDLFAKAKSGLGSSRETSFTYDPATGLYTIVVDPDSQQEQAFSFSDADIDAGQTTAERTFYDKTSEPQVTGFVFNPGPDNPVLQLTYTSFARLRVQETTPTGPSDRSYYVLFGVQTPGAALPAGGTGNYSGIVVAEGEIAPTGYNGLISGTSTLVANFADDSLALTLNLQQDDGLNTPIGSYIFDGTIALNGFFGGARQNSGFVGSLDGSFFGPNADEFGALFDIIEDGPSGRSTIDGVTVGTRD